MEPVQLTKDLRARGYGYAEIEALVRAGELIRLRRGAYVHGEATDDSISDRLRHRRLIESTIPQCRDGVVVSHMSAAVLHGLPIWRDQLERVSVIRDRDGSGRGRRYVRVHGMPLADGDTTVVDGFVLTSLARTVVDLACQQSMRRAVAIGDAALRLVPEDQPEHEQVLRAQLTVALARAARRPGVPRARRVVAFLDGRSESPGESESRVIMHDHGLPTPELQYEVFDSYGYLVARTDFAWLDRGLLGEFDGAVKYSGQFGKPAEQVVLEEKRRENVLRSYGFEIVRWTAPDLRQPATFALMLRQRLASRDAA